MDDSPIGSVAATFYGSGKTYSYNQAGQLSQVWQGSTLLASYDYDYQGLRARKVTTSAALQGAQTVLYHYDQFGRLSAETREDGTPLRSYVWRDEAPLAQIEYSPSRRILYYEVDHLNTPRAASDESGKVVWRWESDAFGSSAPNEDADGDGVKTTINLRFPGQYYDQETGLHYNYFRNYDPRIGRYVQSDPIGLAGGSFSTYQYVAANPLSFIDPDGLRCTYTQSTGSLICTYDTTGQEYLSCNGYAGNGLGINNPDAQNLSNVGPLPRGTYTVGAHTRRKGPVTRRLTPDPSNNMENRAGFLIHGDNSRRDQSASEGCIIVPRSCRESIPTGEILDVIR